MRHVIIPLALSLAAVTGCVSSKVDEAAAVPEPCVAQVERWAAGAQVQDMPQEDGGVIFVKPGVDHVDLFIIVSPKFLPQARKSVAEGQRAKTIGLSKEGVCTHPQNGFPYHTLQFRVTPPKQAASVGL
jgi:hypothetical protein